MDNLTIHEPGKFQGEPRYVPSFYDQWADGLATATGGGSDTSLNAWAVIEVNDDDVRKFPELSEVYAIALEEDESGFLYSQVLMFEHHANRYIAESESAECHFYEEQEAMQEAYSRLEELIEQDKGQCDECGEVIVVNGIRTHAIGCPLVAKISAAEKALRSAEELY